MKKISKVVMFTNGVFMVFNKEGQQHEMQKALLKDLHYNYKKEELAEQLIKDNAKIYISKWDEWKHSLNIAEFCYLIDIANWYERRIREEKIEEIEEKDSI